jgi:uncharacterized protein (DUF4415 family)
VVEKIDDRREYGETRIIAIGQAGECVIVVVYTWRGEVAALSRRERLTLVRRASSKKRSSAEADCLQTDWARVNVLTDAQIEEAVRNDPDAAPILDAAWFASATLVMPKPKQQISIRLDRDVLEHFRQYPRYQTRINAILRAAMEYEKKPR